MNKVGIKAVGIVFFAGSALFSSLLTTNALAEPKDKDRLWLMAKYDANGDKMISVDEIQTKRSNQFLQMDADADGGVSFDEYEQLDALKRRSIIKARFQKLDTDNDGQLSGEEYSSFVGGFERFDSDGDGNITAAEMGNDPQVAVDNAQQDEKTLCISFICVRNKLF